MNLKILLVEDEDRSVELATKSIRRVDELVEIVVMADRDSAIEEIRQNEHDLIICDIRIPPNPRSVDVDESHGLAVHAVARDTCPGTPLVFLTGFRTSDATRRRLSAGGVSDIFGLRNHPMVQLVDKDDLQRLEDVIREFVEALMSLSAACSVHDETDVSPIFVRAVQSYATYTRHTTATIQSNSGLSGAMVGRIRLESQDQAAANFILKVLPFEDANDEFERYRNFVASRLAPGVFAPTVMSVNAGLHKKSALVSTLAGDGYRSLFRLLRDNPADAAHAVAQLRHRLAPWCDNAGLLPVSLRELRSERASDSVASRLEADLGRLHAMEDVSIDMPRVITHGDLHGENVLVDMQGQPLMIDFGDVGFGHAPVDPVTLELSLIYHIEGPARDDTIGSSINWDRWPDVTECYGASPLADFAFECRSWANAIGSARATLAFGYAHSVRQLKYSDVEPDTAIAIALACRAAL